jgi:hypothetical protein
MILEQTYMPMDFGITDTSESYDLQAVGHPLIDTIYYKICTTDLESGTIVFSNIQVMRVSVADASALMESGNNIDFNPNTRTFDRLKLGALMDLLATDADLAAFTSVEESNIAVITAHLNP